MSVENIHQEYELRKKEYTSMCENTPETDIVPECALCVHNPNSMITDRNQEVEIQLYKDRINNLKKSVQQYNTIDNPNIIQYLGLSTCRCCGTHNGSREYVFDNFRIPEGYLHYLEDHNVEMDTVLRNYLTRGIKPEKETIVGYWA